MINFFAAIFAFIGFAVVMIIIASFSVLVMGSINDWIDRMATTIRPDDEHEPVSETFTIEDERR